MKARASQLRSAAAAFFVMLALAVGVAIDAKQQFFEGTLIAMGNLLNPARASRVAAVAALAAKLEAELGYPADALVAQWSVESDWGASPVCGTNYFGMKYVTGRHPAYCLMKTKEYFTQAQLEFWNASRPAGEQADVLEELPDGRKLVRIPDRFAKYASLEASCRDYIWLIQNGAPYRAAWGQFEKDRDHAKLIANIGKAGYSTNSSYGSIVAGRSASPIIQAALQEARKPNNTP